MVLKFGIICLTQDEEQWWALVNLVMNLYTAYNMEISWLVERFISFLKRYMLCGVR
jgi:hypothetical protein